MMAVLEAVMQPAAGMAEPAGFDYAQIDEGLRDEVQAAARSIHQLSAGVVTGIIAIGKRLIEVKGMLDHGQFEAWVEGEFGMKPRMAQNMMNVARQYDDPQKRKTYALLTPSVLYMLAAPSTPDAARVEVEQAAARGEKVTVEFAKEAVRKAKPAVRKAKPEPIVYTPVWELGGKVEAWLRDARSHDPDMILDTIRTGKSSYSYDKLEAYLAEREIAYRKSDLIQAINNVREQRRVAARQAAARAVYVEPKPEPEASTELQMPDDLERVGYALWHTRNADTNKWGWKWQLDLPGSGGGFGRNGDRHFGPFVATPAEAIDGARKSFARRRTEAAPFPSKEEFAELEGAVGQSMTPAATERMRESAEKARRVRDDLDLPDPEEAAAISAVEAERADEEAARIAQDGPVLCDDSLRPVADDGRLEDVRMLHDLLVAARDTAHVHYGELTGRNTDLLPFDRAVATMLEPLASLIDILGGTK